jgi:hypothetical protein
MFALAIKFLLSFCLVIDESLFIKSDHQALCPPSIRKSAPVMKLLASLMRNTPAPLYSSGFERRPSIFCLGHSSWRSGNVINKSLTMSVTM